VSCFGKEISSSLLFSIIFLHESFVFIHFPQ
jgi:hypothetical protein